MPLRDLTGQVMGHWTVLGQATPRISPAGNRRTYWLCRCACGVVREVLAFQLKSGGSVSCGCHRSETAGRLSRARRRGDIVYHSAHRRVIREKGSARHLKCVDCSGGAFDWSYDHTDPDALTDERGRPYSVNPAHYSPRCRPCHRAFDRNRRMTDA